MHLLRTFAASFPRMRVLIKTLSKIASLECALDYLFDLTWTNVLAYLFIYFF